MNEDLKPIHSVNKKSAFFFCQRKNSILLVFIFFTYLLTDAQVQKNLDRDHNEQVTIIGSYDPSINEAFKINMRPGENAVTFQKPDFTFNPLNYKQETKITLEEIKPASIRADQKPTIYDNYLLAGFGSLISPMIDFTHSSGERNDYRLDFHAYSLSSFANIPDYAPSSYSNSLAEIQYKKYFSDHVFTAGFHYGLNANKYYGFKPVDFPQLNIDEVDQNQIFNLLKMNTGLASNYLKSNRLNHKFDLSAYYYFDKYKTSETNIQFDLDLYKSFNMNKMLNYQFLGAKADVEYFALKDSISSKNSMLIYGIPYFKAKYGMFSFQVGINFSYLNVSGYGFKMYPALDITLNLVPEMFTVYGGFGGGLTNNSYLVLSTVNPWVSSLIPTEWKNEKIKIYAGIRGNIASRVNFNVEVNWSSFDNEYFFFNTSDYAGILQFDPPQNKFTAVYDDGSLFQAKGEIAYVFSPDFKIWVGGNFNSYSLDSLSKPYQKPLSMLQFGASYIIKKKVTLKAELYSLGKRYALDYIGNTVEMDGFIDLNIGASYAINEEFSVFLNATNLLNKHYEKFYNYPAQGLQIMGGIGWRF